MTNWNLKGADLVIAVVGVALIVLFLGAGVILALGRPVPTEFWAAAGALSGALVGILVPPSGASQPVVNPVAAAAATHVRSAAVEAASASARQFASDPVQHASAQRALAEVRERAGDTAGLGMPVGRKVATHDVASAAAALAVEAHGVAAEQSATEAAEAAARTTQANARLDEAKQAASGAPDAPADLKRAEDAAARAARERAQAVARATVLRAAARAATAVAPAAADAGAKLSSTYSWPAELAQWIRALPLGVAKVWLLLLIGVVTYVAGVDLATHVGKMSPATPYDTALTNAATALIALGSAAGGAVVGLLAPAPAKASDES